GRLLGNPIAVSAAELAHALELSAAEPGLLSSIFFFAFAVMQLPLGIALDRYGPRHCMLAGSAIVLMGCAVFALATSLAGLIAGRILLGIGSSCSLMAPAALCARP